MACPRTARVRDRRSGRKLPPPRLQKEGSARVDKPGAQVATAGEAVYLEREGSAMKVDGKHLRTIWLEADGASVGIIDQTRLPHEFVTTRLGTLEHAVTAIRSMQVRGAPPI